MSNFQGIEQLMSSLLAAASVLSSSEQAEIQRFIDVGEYGLALETTVDIYAEENKRASSEVVTLIQRLAEAMSMDQESIAKRLPRQ